VRVSLLWRGGPSGRVMERVKGIEPSS
jgi:hypothetical protein